MTRLFSLIVLLAWLLPSYHQISAGNEGDLPPVVSYKLLSMVCDIRLECRLSQAESKTAVDFFVSVECQGNRFNINYPILPNKAFRILVFDKQNRFLGILENTLLEKSTPKQSATSNLPDHIDLLPGQLLGVKTRLIVGDKTTTSTVDGKNEVSMLGPGEYTFQGVLTDRLLSPGLLQLDKEILSRSSDMIAASNLVQLSVKPSKNKRQPSRKSQTPFKAFLFTDRRYLMMGEPFHVISLVVNDSQKPAKLFNPFNNALLVKTHQLLLFDAHGVNIGDCWAKVGGSTRTARKHDWITLQPGGFCGTREKLTAGRYGNAVFQGRPLYMEPGKYAYQFVYSNPNQPNMFPVYSAIAPVEFFAPGKKEEPK